MSVGGNLTMQSTTAIISDTPTLTVDGDLSMDTGSLMLALGGPLVMAVNGSLSLAANAAMWVTTVLDATIGGDVMFAGAPNAIGPQIIAGDALRIATGGDFTMAPDTRLLVGGTGDAIQLAVGGKFVNDDPAALVLADPDNARWLIYLATPPTGHDFGGLDSGNTAIWNTGAFAPITATGNRYVFAHQPTLTFTSLDATKTHGEASPSHRYAVSGLMPGVAAAYLGDMAASVYSGVPHLSSLGDPATASLAGSPYGIDIDGTGVTSTAGYALAFVNAGRLTVTAFAPPAMGDDRRNPLGQSEPTLALMQTAELTSGAVLALCLAGILPEASCAIYAHPANRHLEHVGFAP